MTAVITGASKGIGFELAKQLGAVDDNVISFARSDGFKFLDLESVSSINTLKKEITQELYFGSLTQTLHHDLMDDPALYRMDVKILIQNILSYCDVYLTNHIEISRPKHSQKIKLIIKI